MKIRLTDLRAKLIDALSKSGAENEDLNIIADMLMEYDLHQNTFSGFGDIEGAIRELKQSIGVVEEIVVDKSSMKLIDAHGKSARLVGMKAAEMVIKMSKKTGIALVGIFNSTYHGILETYVRIIAESGLIGIVSANGGPAATVPYGGCQPVTGTNPISYGIPTNGLPIVFDAATSKFPYGSIRLAKERNQLLPDLSYFDKYGKVTNDPSQAVAIIPFGEHKGFAINLLLEILTGALVGAKMGLQTKDETDLGSVFIAIDPAFFGDIKKFKNDTSKLALEIESVNAQDPKQSVQVPGYRGEKFKQLILNDGYIEIEDRIWNMLNL
jgi:LDH2 family malate/lactate/ureidoglycolate dehydrogenase